MPLGELVVRFTAWVTLVAWAAAEWLRSGAHRQGGDDWARRAFTAGAVALIAHIGAAFHLRYGWSHAAAARDTARQTEEVTGLAFGGGVFINYLFLALWVAEAGWWWRAPASFLARPAVLEWSVRAVFLFMFVNGAIVFAHGPVRWLGATAVLAAVCAWYRRPAREGRHV